MACSTIEKEPKFDYEQFLSSNIVFNKVLKRYEVSLPFSECHDLLSDNYLHCEARLKHW